MKKMSKVDVVIRRLEERNKVFTVKLLGSRKNQADGFYIMMLNQSLTCTVNKKRSLYHGISQNTIDLLKEAEIDFKIV